MARTGILGKRPVFRSVVGTPRGCKISGQARRNEVNWRAFRKGSGIVAAGRQKDASKELAAVLEELQKIGDRDRLNKSE